MNNNQNNDFNSIYNNTNTSSNNTTSSNNNQFNNTSFFNNQSVNNMNFQTTNNQQFNNVNAQVNNNQQISNVNFETHNNQNINNNIETLDIKPNNINPNSNVTVNNNFTTIVNSNDQAFNNAINILPINELNNESQSSSDESNYKPVNVSLNPNITEFHRRNLLIAFVGFKYEKFCKDKFNIWALIFAEFYLLYRRMTTLGLMFLLLRGASFIISKPLYSIIINIILAFTFNKLYLYHAKRKILSIEKRNKNATYEVLRELSLSAGGTKASNAVAALSVSIIIAIITVISISISGGALNGKLPNINILVLLGKNPEFKGELSYEDNININNYYEIEMPNEIASSATTGNNIIGGIKTNPNDNYSNCHYKFNALKGYSDSKNLASQMAKYYHATNKPEELQINSITWYHITYENTGIVNAYLTSRNKRVYIYEFREEQNANSTSCAEYNNSIINSIYYK